MPQFGISDRRTRGETPHGARTAAPVRVFGEAGSPPPPQPYD